MPNQHILATILLLSISPTSLFACTIHNTDSGACTTKYLPQSSDLDAIEAARVRWTADIPFCGPHVASYYQPCVPALPTEAWTSIDANFPYGRLISDDERGLDVHSIRSKDRWVEETVTSTIEARIELEKGQGDYHYFRNKDCQEAYARYTCWMNFPRCSEFGESLPMCQSVCENLFRVCGFASDIWRCETDLIDGADEHDTTAFFPGQPFKRNEFLPKSNDPKAICTPSIKGAAPSQNVVRLLLILPGFVCVAFHLLF